MGELIKKWYFIFNVETVTVTNSSGVEKGAIEWTERRESEAVWSDWNYERPPQSFFYCQIKIAE
ncbi:hypothetical protein DXN04_27210 [Chitinophaga silvisoli]|uniref:Uncharacterized protein n=1 Tax=Chitinophaga silvisoli TaxID=2291814 RepID=A0A3E1NV77_9BACT|nr:hypothetical protein DXN04_27210 [Chitinophaga silvisoli]